MDSVTDFASTIWELAKDQWITTGTLVSLFFLVVLAAVAFVNRKRLVIRPFVNDEPELLRPFAHFTDRVGEAIQRVVEVHLRAREAACDPDVFADLAMAPRGEASELNAYLNETSDEKMGRWAKLALLIFRWVFRPPTLTGTVYLAQGTVKGPMRLEGSTVSVSCSYLQRGARPLAIDKVSQRMDDYWNIEGMARELALKLIIRISSDVGTVSWEALDLATEALREWPPKKTIKSDGMGDFERSKGKLEEALDYDPKSPLIHYNLGMIHYYRYNLAGNQEAIKHFDTAWQTSNARFQYLARVGLARCYCQNYHRFGMETEEQKQRAKRAAAEALRIVEEVRRDQKKLKAQLRTDYARALYARAFASHLTEEPDDLESAIEDYLSIIRLYSEPFRRHVETRPRDVAGGIPILKKERPEVPAVIYNNLAYNLMVRGGRFVASEGAALDYELAKTLLELSLEAEPDYKFALANLGNIERLLGRYGEAERIYRRALAQDPGYANGYKELAWVCLSAGREDEAQAALEEAIDLAGGDEQRSKIKEWFARAMWYEGRVEESKALADEALALNPENTELRAWLASSTVV